jgi:hypothetical protein
LDCVPEYVLDHHQEAGRQRLALMSRLLDPMHRHNDRSIDAFLSQCADPAWWTQTIAFTAASGRVPGAGPS